VRIVSLTECGLSLFGEDERIGKVKCMKCFLLISEESLKSHSLLWYHTRAEGFTYVSFTLLLRTVLVEMSANGAQVVPFGRPLGGANV
jgi:hypothetical protein